MGHDSWRLIMVNSLVDRPFMIYEKAQQNLAQESIKTLKSND